MATINIIIIIIIIVCQSLQDCMRMKPTYKGKDIRH